MLVKTMPRRACITHVGCEGSGYPASHHLCSATLSSIEQISSRVAAHRGTGNTHSLIRLTRGGHTYLRTPERTRRRSARQALSKPSAPGSNVAEDLNHRTDEPCVTGATGAA